MTIRATTVAHADPGTPIAGAPRLPEDQNPVHDRVEDVRHDERDHHRAHDAHALQVAAERRVQQQRRDAPREDVR